MLDEFGFELIVSYARSPIAHHNTCIDAHIKVYGELGHFATVSLLSHYHFDDKFDVECVSVEQWANHAARKIEPLIDERFYELAQKGRHTTADILRHMVRVNPYQEL